MNIKAKFKGTDGSLGYRTGTTYFLQVRVSVTGHPTIVSSIPYAGICPYQSWDTFWMNWEKV